MKTKGDILRDNLAGMSVRIPPVLLPHIDIAMQAYADQQVLNYKTQLRKEVNHLLVITGSTQYVKVIELLDKV